MISEHRRPFLAFVLVAVFCAVVMGESILADRVTPGAQRVDITRIDSAATRAPTAPRAGSPRGDGTPAQSPQPPSTSGVPGPAVPAGAGTAPANGSYAGPDQGGTKSGSTAPVTARKHRKGDRRPGGSAADQESVVEAGQDQTDAGDEPNPDDPSPSAGESASPEADETEPADPPPAD